MINYKTVCFYAYGCGKERCSLVKNEKGAMKMGTLGNRKSLRWKIVRMLLFGWLLPLLIFTLGMIFSVSSMIKNQIEKTIVVSSDKAVEICDMQLREMIASSKSASYNSTIRDSYIKYLRYGESIRDKRAINNFLAQQYKYDARILCTMLFFLDDPQELFYTYNTYQDNNTGNQLYSRKNYFMNYLQEKVIEKCKTLDTGIAMMESDGHLYLVRNLVNSSFVPYAIIVMELKPEDMFESLNSIWGMEDYEIYIDGVALMKNGVEKRFSKDFIKNPTDNSVYYNDQKEAYVYKVVEWEEQQIAYVVELNSKSIIDETVVMLSHKKPDSVINVKVEFGEGEGKVPLDNIAKRAAAYKPKERVTYKMIKEYIEAKYGFKVHTAYIAEVKRDLGLPMYDAPNAVEELKQPRKHPTPEKVEAIKDALKHFEVI